MSPKRKSLLPLLTYSQSSSCSFCSKRNTASSKVLTVSSYTWEIRERCLPCLPALQKCVRSVRIYLSTSCLIQLDDRRKILSRITAWRPHLPHQLQPQICNPSSSPFPRNCDGKFTPTSSPPPLPIRKAQKSKSPTLAPQSIRSSKSRKKSTRTPFSHSAQPPTPTKEKAGTTGHLPFRTTTRERMSSYESTQIGEND